MRRIVDYHICRAGAGDINSVLRYLADDVNAHIVGGYIPQGGVSVAFDMNKQYYAATQATIKYKETDGSAI